jgi:hypothetical protein
MKRLTLASLILSSCLSLPACAHQMNLVDVQVQDEDTGNLLQRMHYAGRNYIAGQPGHRFSVTLQNRTGERVLAVLSVDGVNAVSGQTASSSQAGYVLDPWQRIEVSGWRKSYSDIAEFYFTDLPDSYAARTGRPDNVGVIGVAAFRERQVEPVPYYAPPQVGGIDESAERDRESAADAGAPATMQAPRAEAQAEAKSSGALASASAPYDSTSRDDNSVAQELGTGHGQRRYDPVSETQFERESSRPNQIVSLFYDSYAALAARGVIPQPYYQRPSSPDPFPIGFVPDPNN